MASEAKNHIISITWGCSSCYQTESVYPVNWDGQIHVDNGVLQVMDLLTYRYIMWTQAHEVPTRIYDRTWPAADVPCPGDPGWKSLVTPGSASTLEGLRLQVTGSADTVIRLTFAEVIVEFSLEDLSAREHLSFAVGPKYGGQRVEVFYGPDARPRVSRAAFLARLSAEGKAGQLLLPEDFSGAAPINYHSMWGAELNRGDTVEAKFDIVGALPAEGNCSLRLQMTARFGYMEQKNTDSFEFLVCLNGKDYPVSYLFSVRISLPKLEDIYLSVPWSGLRAKGNTISVSCLRGEHPLVIHRVFVGAERPTLAGELKGLPPLPRERRVHVGAETDLLTPENGDVERLIADFKAEETGDYILLRERAAKCPAEQMQTIAGELADCGFYACTCAGSDEADEILSKTLGRHYLGIHGHEVSNLAYGWGEPDPMSERIHRTLSGCQAAYLRRMKAYRVVGQAVPMMYLDYLAGVETVITETPGSHVTTMFAASRGAARAFDRSQYGLHIANHVQMAPLSPEHVRREFIVAFEAWLYGMTVIYDEECSQRYNHDTIYAHSDAFPTAYRRILQSVYHYANALPLGKEQVEVGFLMGQYDFIIGGCQAGPSCKRTKFWGAFGPESAGWEFDTPEAGWKMLDTFMPGVWLYPVEQPRDKIRTFFSGTPYGQVDLVPAIADAEHLGRYKALILPGWNTMTDAVYDELTEYARTGGHLLLCAAQCTTHDTRDWLVEKKDYRLYNGGDLRALCGVQIGGLHGVSNRVEYDGEVFAATPGLPAFETVLCENTRVLARDDCGRPILVEHTVGAGRVWTLTAGEFWGADALTELRERIAENFAKEHLPTVCPGGNCRDVSIHIYSEPLAAHAVLTNTDWTSAGNMKKVTLTHRDTLQTVPVTVREGELRHVLFCDGAVLSYPIPGCIATVSESTGERTVFSVSGMGRCMLDIFARPGARISLDGEAVQTEGTCLNIDFGSVWSRHTLEIIG